MQQCDHKRGTTDPDIRQNAAYEFMIVGHSSTLPSSLSFSDASGEPPLTIATPRDPITRVHRTATSTGNSRLPNRGAAYEYGVFVVAGCLPLLNKMFLFPYPIRNADRTPSKDSLSSAILIAMSHWAGMRHDIFLKSIV